MAASTSTAGYNLLPFAVMAGAWLGPLCMFWLYVWGPLRPFTYPSGELFPGLLPFVSTGFACGLAWWMPRAYFKIRKFERNGRLYETLGIRWFRRIVPNGEIANRLRRRKDPRFRFITRTSVTSFLRTTENSERGHLVLLLVGAASAAFAWNIGWLGWSLYLGIGNVVVNVYPIMLQRYNRARVVPICTGGAR